MKLDGTFNNPAGNAFGEAYFKLLDRKVKNPKLSRYYREFLKGTNPDRIVASLKPAADSAR